MGRSGRSQGGHGCDQNALYKILKELIKIKDKASDAIFTLILYPETLVKTLVHFCVWCDVCTCVYVGRSVWTCRWSLEADVRCPPWWRSFCAWRQTLSLSLSSLTQLVHLARFPWGSPIHLFIFLKFFFFTLSTSCMWGVTVRLPGQLNTYVGSGVWTPVLTLQWQTLYLLCHLLNLSLTVFGYVVQASLKCLLQPPKN